MCEIKARRMALSYQLREPCVIDVAAKVARLNVRMPKTGQKQNERQNQYATCFFSEEIRSGAQGKTISRDSSVYARIVHGRRQKTFYMECQLRTQWRV